MKAMVLAANAPIESAPLKRVDLPEPVPAAGQVRLKVRCCAICRTDLHVIEGDLPPRKRPLVPGHQIVGVVDRLGEGCRHLAVGQRAGVAWLRHACGRCRFCTTGRENLCDDQQFTGYHADGGYAEYAVVAEDFAYPIPAGFSDVEAAPLLCAGIVGYRALKRSRLRDGGTLAIYGFGSSAHVIMQIALHRGCKVYVVTRDARHQRLAAEMGAAWVGDSAAALPVAVESAIVFAPAGELVPEALTKLDKGGTVALAGITMTPVPQMDYQQCLFYERDIRSVTANTRADGRELLDLAATIPLRPRTVSYPLEGANQALADLKADRINGTGVLIVSQ
ncbi:MAG: zinc-dependent alcohol dehydrogenase family protein [Phycisphaerae bacterium]|nr:zinc-dependent alcohol dehydrogenase family protein [Phycisphaerae bacterium]